MPFGVDLDGAGAVLYFVIELIKLNGILLLNTKSKLLNKYNE